jgi:hypothetical protein
MQRRGRVAVLALSLIVYGCGGGGGGSGGSTPVIVTPPPPTPPPPPPPPPPVISTSGAYISLTEIRFYPGGYNPGSGAYSNVSSDRTGQFPIVTGLPLFSVFSGAATNYSTFEKFAFGVDTAGLFYFWAQAPADSRVVSPISHLLMGNTTESKLETQLGINGSLFGLQADRDLKSFSAIAALSSTDANVVADGERLLAHHLRIHMLNAALNNFSPFEQDPTGAFTFLPTTTSAGATGLHDFLADSPAAFIYTNDAMVALLNRSPAITTRGYSPDVLRAAAHLINAYAAAIPVRISSREQAARFMIGIKGYLVPELTRLLAMNTLAAANSVLAITAPTILSETARYAEQLPFNVNDNLFPSPDFYTLSSGGSKLVDATDIGSNGDGPFSSNDLHSEPSVTDGGHFFSGGSRVTGVTVPSANAAQISARRNSDGTVLIQALAAFTGVTYFDYTVEHTRGDIKQGRVYVRVR